MSSSDVRMIKFKSSEGDIFEVEDKAVFLSQTIKQLVEDGLADDGQAVPLLRISSDTLSKVIEYCRKHAGIGAGVVGFEKSEAEEENLKAWDAEFVKFEEIAPLFELLDAANFLDIKDLQELTCQAVADNIKDKSVEEVREIFGIENDYTEEEEAELRRQHAWAFE